MLKNLILAFLFMASLGCGAQEIKPENRVVCVGYYSNEVEYDISDDPHVEGYSLELFREGSVYFGKFYSASGLAGDTPNGRLDKLNYDKNTGQLSFSAKLTTGSTFDRKGNSIPANFLIEFSGKFSKKNVSGLLTTRSAYTLSKIDSSEKITLKRIGNYDYSLPDSYESWLKQPLNNGPQW